MWCARQMRDDRLEPCVIRHHVVTVGIAQRHADVLPDLDAHRTLRDVGIDARTPTCSSRVEPKSATEKVVANATRPG